MAVTEASGCGEAPQCVVSAIAADFAILHSPTATDPEKAAALVYLGHWLGDIHQPLHSSYRDDQGGNEVNSNGLCTNNLHSTWDTCILQSRALAGGRSIEDVRALAAAWSGQVGDVERAQWLSSQPWQWSAESYAVAIRPEVGYCVMVRARANIPRRRWRWRRPGAASRRCRLHGLGDAGHPAPHHPGRRPLRPPAQSRRWIRPIAADRPPFGPFWIGMRQVGAPFPSIRDSPPFDLAQGVRRRLPFGFPPP